MQCTACQYFLWNIRDRRCPECGTGFRVSDHTFRPGSVQFRCLHCDQSYYGTDAESGHLVPRTFDCVRCEARIDMDEMVVLPACGVDERDATERHPWFERRQGLVMSWLTTVAVSCFSPGRLMRLTREDEPARPSLAFMAATLAVAFVGGLGVLLLFLFMMGGMAGGYSFSTMMSMAATFLIPFGILAGAIGVWLLATHAVLMLTGSTKGLKRTTHAIAYSCGPVVLSAFPCLGAYVIPFAALWWIINAAFMVTTAHRVSGVRAAAAVLAMPTLAAAGLIALLVHAIR